MNFIKVSKPVPETAGAGEVGLPGRAPVWESPADLVMIYGPDTDQNTLTALLDCAAKKCLTVKLIGDGKSALNLAEVAACRQSGAMGPATQVLVTVHGMRSNAGHFIEYGLHGERLLTAEFMHLLRGSHPEGETTQSAWSGTVHFMSCESGKMRDEIFKDKALWRGGNYVLHASGKAVLKDSVLSNAMSVMDYLGECKREHREPDFFGMTRRLLATTGESFTLAGSKLIAPLIVHAPRMPEHSLADYVNKMHTADEKKLMRGEAQDIGQLLATDLEKPHTISSHRLEKALNIFNVRLSRNKVEQAANVLDHFPQLAIGIQGKAMPILEASDSGHVPILAKLIALGADIHTKGDLGYTPLALACARGHLDAARLLLGAGAVASEFFDKAALSILHLAVTSNNASLVDYLIGLPQVAALRNYQDSDGLTALHLAAANGRLEMVNILQKARVNFLLKNNDGHIPAVLAGLNGHHAVVAAMLKPSRRKKSAKPSS